MCLSKFLIQIKEPVARRANVRKWVTARLYDLSQALSGSGGFWMVESTSIIFYGLLRVIQSLKKRDAQSFARVIKSRHIFLAKFIDLLMILVL